MKPDTRRAIRTSVHTVGALAMLAMLAWIIWKVPSPTLIGLGLTAILFVREMFHGAENVTARIKFDASTTGVTGEVEPARAAQDVADEAQDEANRIKGETQ